MLLKTFLLLLLASNLYASTLLDGSYNLEATVSESQSNESYKFKMHLDVLDYQITGTVDYYQDGCSGVVTGEVLSNNILKLSETITKGANICDNGSYTLALKYGLISKAKHYLLEDKQHSVTLNDYHFTPNKNVWDDSALLQKIHHTKIAIEELEYTLYRPQRLIEKALEKKALSQYFLDHNTTLFHNNQCTKPPLAPKPKPLFDTKEKAKKYALAYCSVSFGCRVGVELARHKLDTASKRFLASQSCSLMVMTYQKENTLLDETAFNLLDAVSYAGCQDSEDGFLSGVVQGGSCVMSAVTRLARVTQYVNCIDSKTASFHNSYLDWKNEPSKKQKECMVHLDIVNNTAKVIETYTDKISSIQHKISTKKRELAELENAVQNGLKLKKKQQDLLDTLQKNRRL